MTAVTFERRDSAHTRLFLAALVVVLVLYAAVGTLVIRHEAETGVRVAEASSVVVEVPVSSVADVPGSQATMVDGASSRVSSPAVAVEDGLPAGASSAWWTGVQGQLLQEPYRFAPSDDATTIMAMNPAQRFHVVVDQAGVWVTPRQPAAANVNPEGAVAEVASPAWEWGLTLVGFGYGDLLSPVALGANGPSLSSDGARVAYVYEARDVSMAAGAMITEWWRNDERGLEHGLTLDQAPGGRDESLGQPLRLAFSVHGGLTPRLGDDGESIDLRSGASIVLRYGELHVYDATGRELNASLSTDDTAIQILVDDADAIYPIIVDPLVTTPIWTTTGENAWDEYGESVASAGDVNGDGYADVIVGAINYPNWSGRGRAYVYHGSPTGLENSPAMTLTGEQDYDLFACSVAGAGDVNGDGYADVIIGAMAAGWGSHGSGAGRVYVYHGSSAGLSATPALTLSGTLGGDAFGDSVAGVGDLNGDGYADIMVGAVGYAFSNGGAFVYMGSADGLTSTPALTLTGTATWDEFGCSVAGAGDVNGDGYADVIVGADWAAGYKGMAYVYHGSSAGLSATPAITYTGENTSDQFGTAVATAGDVDGDGYADVIVGAGNYGNLGWGRVYVYHGSNQGLSATPVITFAGESPGDHLGRSLASLGDMNGDGYADVIVGAPGVGEYHGRCTVYHGSATGLLATPVLSITGESQYFQLGGAVAGAGDVNGDGYGDALVGEPGFGDPWTDGEAWVTDDRGRAHLYLGAAPGLLENSSVIGTGVGSGDMVGHCVATAGDVNGDGFADVLVGGDTDKSSGAVFVHHGARGGLANTPEVTLLGEEAGDEFGYSLASAGDVNGDGYADVIVGAKGAAGSVGRAYIYHGSATGLGATPALTLTGKVSYDWFGVSVDGAGDLNGDGFADVVIGTHCYIEPIRPGSAFVYFGSETGLSPSPAITLTGEGNGDLFGYVVAGPGDLNGDGYADLAIAAPAYPSEMRRGRVYVYYGSSDGLATEPGRVLTGESDWDWFGGDLAGAGDVDSDGFGDLLVGAPSYDDVAKYGRAYLYRGSVLGLMDTPAWTLTGQTEWGRMGSALAGAGDLNGDGFADVLVGLAKWLLSTELDRAHVYHGSPSGLATTPVITLTAGNTNDGFGSALAGAGDVNGDGFADAVVGAPTYDQYRGQAHVFYSGQTVGRPVLAQQTQPDGLPVQPWCISQIDTGFRVQMRATDPMGRGRVKLQIEAAPPGTPIGDPTAITRVSDAWTDVTATSDGVTLTLDITGLDHDTLYRWRARVLYAPQSVTEAGITAPPNPAHGPWRRLDAQTREADVRVLLYPKPPVATDDTASTDEDTPNTIDVLANDSDLNGDTLMVSAVGLPDHGIAIISGGQVIYTPTNRCADYTATFTYTCSDGALTDDATVTVAVSANNDPPQAADQTASTDENMAVGGNSGATDPDVDDVLSYALSGGPLYGKATVDGAGAWKYVPADRPVSYADVFTLTVRDRGGLIATQAITVNVSAVEHSHDASLTMGPDPFCPSWLIYYELAFTNTHESAIANLVITSPLPGWPCNGAWLDETSTLDGELDGYTSMFVFGAESVAAGETVYARTILRSYSTVSGLVKNAFYVSADDLAATETYTYAALASNGVCDAPTPTPTAEPEPTSSLKGLFLPLIDSR